MASKWEVESCDRDDNPDIFIRKLSATFTLSVLKMEAMRGKWMGFVDLTKGSGPKPFLSTLLYKTAEGAKRAVERDFQKFLERHLKALKK